ncbi:hypothetical protein PRZ48_008776 [Zasmidium cellare]|uniref:Nucleoside phosphorylase domain-containing protein n=1 Tax=Zasmidium cellare TaxID=395010 RepID=A0ABR0EGF8_ZASCE|nr:hypothetical protein PRZ48_008776 [Zasmidium cellare]
MSTLHTQLQQPPPASRDDFRIAVICALPEERDTVEALMLRHYKSEGQRYGKARGDDNSYTLGEIGGKPVVLVAPRDMGTTNTRDLARSLRISFPNILYAFVVGIAGGAPFVYDGNEWKESDIHLGDVIVSTHVIEYDFGREYENVFRRRADAEHTLSRATAEITNFVNQFVNRRSEAFTRVLRKTNAELRSYTKLQTDPGEYHDHPGPDVDHVYAPGYRHKHQAPDSCATCSKCTEWHHVVCEEALRLDCLSLGCVPQHSNPVRDTKIHFGRYASGNGVMKSGHRRDLLVREEQVIAFEMEGAGAWEVFGTTVVKGVVDYADSHKNKRWRGYPAARAALCAAAMIEEIELPDRQHRETSQNATVASHPTVQQPWLLPRTANPQYVGYTDVLERLERCMIHQGDRQVVFVLSGMGGVGKSETVLQFVAKNDGVLRQRFWAVLWVDCGSEASAQADFKKIGSLCGCRYIPNGSKVSVILTTRLSDAKKYASTDPRDARSKLFLQLQGLDRISAISLILDASDIGERSQHTNDRAEQIADALDYHPLAITVASSLIQSAVYSLEEYANAIDGRLARKELLDTTSEQARYQKVSTTFEVSAESLQSLGSTDPSAKAALALLDVLGFMHHRDVSEDIFVRAWEYEEDILFTYNTEDRSQQRDAETGNHLHGKVCSQQELCRIWNIYAWQMYHASSARTVEICLYLLKQTQELSRKRPMPLLVAGAQHLLGMAYEAEGQIPEAVEILEQVVRVREEKLAEDHPDRLASQHELASAYQDNRQITKAVKILEHVVEIREEKLAEDHPDRLASQHQLAYIYSASGQIPKAIEILEHVVQVQDKLAEDHPHRLVSQHELARAYHNNRHIPQAIEILEHVVKVQEKLVQDHPQRLASQYELARAYKANGEFSRAIGLLNIVVAIERKKLPVGHPNRTMSEDLLAYVIRKRQDMYLTE